MHTKRIGSTCPSYINYRLKSEVSITLRCWLCSTRYTAVRIKNCSKSTSAIKIVKPLRATTKLTPFVFSEYEWDTKENTGRIVRTVVCQDTSRAEAISNSEKIKPIALAVIYSVSSLILFFFLNSVATC